MYMAKKILIVEDDFDTRYVLSLVLKNEGYEILTAGDGECALSVANERKPDLVITDVSMPRLNGIDLTRKLKLNDQTCATPVLAITGYGGQTVKNALDAGASACARKPIKFEEFIPIVKSLLA